MTTMKKLNPATAEKGVATSRINPPLKWHQGGKHDLAQWIIGLMPPRCANPNKPDPNDAGWLHYVEPYAGGLSVLLANDPEGISEVVNDLNGYLTNFWAVLRDDEEFKRFDRLASMTEFGQPMYEAAASEYQNALAHPDPARRAWLFFVACRQSMSGRMKNFPPMVRQRTRRGMQDHVSAWLSCVERLPEVHARLKRVAILNKPALEVIRKEDGPRTLFYLDPPYLHETRATTGEYEHEMSPIQHRELCVALGQVKGRFLLSGYPSEMYDRYANEFGWTRHEMKINNHAAGGKTKRVMTECVWANF